MLKKFLPLFLIAAFLSAVPVLAAVPDEASAAEWRRAETLLLNRQAQEAYPLFNTLLQRYPGHSSLMLGLARSAALTGRYEEAEGIYRDLLQKFPGDPIL
ncbi:MAG: tetratricopeptide repeat protein, partial [Deltaproteobacteria bacterium]|nr:tetratricopeptide repeat protein [Deltaproteobacteria bacterium]